GPRGTGKTSSARILAKSLNCLASKVPTEQPCGQCDVCQRIARGESMDVIEIDAASNTGVDNIRELIERAQFAPVQCRHKVYIIDECHMLSTAAFNSLLKTLEEPPPRVVFVLATTDPQRVLSTIISRCQRFDFRRIPLDAMVRHLTVARPAQPPHPSRYRRKSLGFSRRSPRTRFNGTPKSHCLG
ncbi:MAG: DNA polymerase III subunit gamma/tau, partial [Oscillatoria sp. Prado101]|nr:DNA polymerase III subunit gamma/tau [Oscillatoria sp. Prado101]